MLFSFFVNLGIFCELDLFAQIIDGFNIVNYFLLTRATTLHQVLILLSCALHAFLLLLTNFTQIFELLFQILQNFFFWKFHILEGLEFETRDLISKLLDLLSLLLFLVSLVLNLFISLRDFSLKRRDALHFWGGHANGCSYIRCLVKNLIISLFTLLDV